MVDKKVVSLRGEPEGPDEDVINLLQKLLKQAQAGAIKEIMVVVGHDDGSIDSDFEGFLGNPQLMFGHAQDLALFYRDTYFNPFTNVIEDTED